MKFLRTQKDVEGEIKRMLRSCVQLRWAVAWASHDFPLFHLLQEHRAKIRQMTVGIHFYQTHPDYIAAFNRLTDSNWWLSQQPQDEFEKRIWRCRAAFLEVRFYEPG